ncbi:MAG: hypothetical protein K9L28_10135 [Synergistales bacterium]|nr:hypothetical protein [Synergistales bacterium]
MRRSAVVVILAVGLLFSLSAVVMAHPPSKLALEYNRESGVLTVRAWHSVSDAGSHYVESYEVTVDGDRRYTLHASSQQGSGEAVALFHLGKLKDETEIHVKATCNKFGSLERTITVE